MSETISLFSALEVLCRDSLESTVAEVREQADDGEITVAMQAVIFAADALDRIADERPALNVGSLGLAYLENQRDIARRGLKGLRPTR